ncbi:MAG: primosome assembly protein PriA, partial [Jiangellaceae bacterium]
ALGFPPVVRAVEVSGAAADVADLLRLIDLPPGSEILGPVPTNEDGHERALMRAARGSSTALSAAVKAAQAVRTARRSGGAVRIRVDPVDLG